ncbi:MAG: cysteine peptidase family C39 domain-containing protein [bacterium]|nr:cysteine peptidase family C39 domain-containing protein [bacterium]
MANEINISPIEELNTEPIDTISRAVIKAAAAVSEPIVPVSTTLPEDADEIKYTHFPQQTSGLCGPASLRILLSHFDKNYTEGDLAKISGATEEYGVEHDGLIKAVKALGGHVFAKENATIEDLKYFIKEEKLPVLIDWFDKDFDKDDDYYGDHYGVIANITDKHIIVVDPASKKVKRHLDIKDFPYVWFGFVGQDNRAVSWNWFMVVTFEPKQFKVLGNYY